MSYGKSYSVDHQRSLSIKDIVDVAPLAMLNPDQQEVLEPAGKSTAKTQQYLCEPHIDDHLHAENGNTTTSTGKKSYAPHVNQVSLLLSKSLYGYYLQSSKRICVLQSDIPINIF